MSGPLLDRIDIQLEVPPVAAKELALFGNEGAERDQTRTTAAAAARVAAARERQSARGALLARSGILNAHLSPRDLGTVAPLDAPARALLEAAIERLGLSARAYHRIWRLARTLADLDGVEAVATDQIAEAVTYRSLDRPVTSS